MGHVRLGRLPRTRAWKEVVNLIAAGADASQVAMATINAAEKAFARVSEDDGFNHASWLMTQLAIAAKKEDFRGHLSSVGVEFSENASLPEIASAISDAMDTKLSKGRSRSDFGEIAQRALVGAITDHISPKLLTLFGDDPTTTRNAFSELGKKKEFGDLSRSYFAKFTNECLQYLLSRTLKTNIGEGQRFPTMNQVNLFEKAINTHCHEAAKIVEEYSGDWFSKHRFQEGGDISWESTRGFASYAMAKMTSELKEGAITNAS